jgi:hypothetical protein
MLSVVRYVDTGSRDPEHALGAWLDAVLIQDSSVVSVRVQTGFFGADSLGLVVRRSTAFA